MNDPPQATNWSRFTFSSYFRLSGRLCDWCDRVNNIFILQPVLFNFSILNIYSKQQLSMIIVNQKNVRKFSSNVQIQNVQSKAYIYLKVHLLGHAKPILKTYLWWSAARVAGLLGSTPPASSRRPASRGMANRMWHET